MKQKLPKKFNFEILTYLIHQDMHLTILKPEYISYSNSYPTYVPYIQFKKHAKPSTWSQQVMKMPCQMTQSPLHQRFICKKIAH